MAGLSMNNLGRIAKVVALLLFLLPWVTVSCADQTLVSMTGVDLATGHINMAANPMGGASAPTPAAHGGDLYVILGALLILAGIAVTFVLKGSKGSLVAAACSALAAALLSYTVFVRIKAQAVADSSASAGDSSGMNTQQLAEMIRVNIQIGFYLCLAALIAAVLFDFLAMQRAGPPAVAAAPAAEPPPGS